jgi:dTDP-4-dehydrorhamnose reductase
MRILVLGANGLLGSAIFHELAENNEWLLWGTVRAEGLLRFFPTRLRSKIICGVDACDILQLSNLLEKQKPDVVINCISLPKPLLEINNPLDLIPIYALLPHQLAHLCEVGGARLIHISTDGVFSGAKGQYSEIDIPDAYDLYGRCKLIGEVNAPHVITLRTSIIGPELNSSNGLLEWFLAQKDVCKCFRKSIFSGLPTVVLAKIIRNYVIPRVDLFGIYHLSSNPISKFDLLKLVAAEYGKSIDLIPVDEPICDRSLNAERFYAATGFRAPEWPELIRIMRNYKLTNR